MANPKLTSFKEDKTLKNTVTALAICLLASFQGSTAKAEMGDRIEAYDISKEAYIYAFPMIAGYKAFYEFNVDKASSQYKGPLNTIISDANVFTYKDTAIVTPNSDTPYSMMQVDLRAEPMVFCVPAVDKSRYYSVQLTDMYSFNYGYVGSRATGNEAGCYMIAGPGWNGNKPDGISKVFNSETQFGLVIFRTQLFNAGDIANIKTIQAQYMAKPLSAFLKQPAPPVLPLPNFPAFEADAFKLKAFSYLNFLTAVCSRGARGNGITSEIRSYRYWSRRFVRTSESR